MTEAHMQKASVVQRREMSEGQICGSTDQIQPSLFPRPYLELLGELAFDRRARRVQSYLRVKNIHVQSNLICHCDLRFLEECIVSLDQPSVRVLRIAPSGRFSELSLPVTHFIRRCRIRGIASLNLLILARSLQQAGKTYLGDAIEMSREEILLHAAALGRTRDPKRLVDHFERLLANFDFKLGMRAPGWQRPSETFARDLECHLRQLEKKCTSRTQTRILRVVGN